MTSDDIEKFMARAFNMDCPRMVFRKTTTESTHRTYEGPGSIYQTAEGNLIFKLYATGEPDYSTLARHFGPDSIKPGEIIPRQEFFSLAATSQYGETWTDDFILPEVNQGVVHGPVATGSLHKLTKINPDPHSRNFRPHLGLIFTDFEYPGNTSTITKTFVGGTETGESGDWTQALFKAADLQFHLQRVRGSVSLSAQSQNMTLPQHLDLRICEALEFTLFESKQWIVKTTCENEQITTTLRCFPKGRVNEVSRPPVGFRSHQNGEHVWNLFGKYLEYVITHPQPEWHPLSESVHSAVMGDANSLDAGLLTLSVAIEGILKIGFPKLAAPDDSLREQIEIACKMISDSDLKDTFKPRVLSALNAMQTPRAKDKLLALQQSGIIRKEFVDAWQATRHPSVHADGLDKTAIAKIFRNYQSARTLFNELIFLVIGYAGQYTDYSVVGWPQRAFEKSMKDVENDQALLVSPNAETQDG